MGAPLVAIRRCTLSTLLLAAACSPDGESTFDSPSGAAGTTMSAGAATAAGGTSAGGGASSAAGTAPSSAGAPSSGGDGSGPAVPAAPASCPTIADGTITVLERDVQLWTGPPGMKGPLVFYWHGTGGEATEAQWGLSGVLDEIQATGGVVASFTTTTAQGSNTGNRVWYTGDFEMADIIFACAVQQGLVDARQVFTAGCSAGGLQAGAMVYGRSSYLAAAMPNSGGIIGSPEIEDPAHVPAVITTHGGPQDVVIISFASSSARLGQDIAAQGGFVVNCNHSGDHCMSPPEVIAAQWQFMKAHPFGVAPKPYEAGLPATFPPICQIVE
jgi:hypothetical protein